MNSPIVWVAAFAFLGQIAKSFYDSWQAGRVHNWDVQDREDKHVESMRGIEVVREDVNGKMAQLIKVSGDAREAEGNLAGRAELHSEQASKSVKVKKAVPSGQEKQK